MIKIYKVDTFMKSYDYGLFFGKKEIRILWRTDYVAPDRLENYLDKEIRLGYTDFDISDIITHP